jgi:uncharacterized protein YcbK (DUF882 family)
MIDLREILKSLSFDDQTPEVKENLLILLQRINVIREAYGKPMTITSGLRSMADHLRIYAEKGITDKNKIPMKSKHLYGQAVDISDPKKKLQKWILENLSVVEEAGLWMEDFSATPNWVHFQTVPPASGKRFFKP